jgi:putative transposase
MIRAHKIELKPNKTQIAHFRQSCGARRFAYNWALETWQKEYKAGSKPTAYSIRKAYTAYRREDLPWSYEVSKYCSENAILDLGQAFAGFFNKRTKYPSFKRKGINESYRVNAYGNKVEFDGKRIKLPKIGWVRIKESFRFESVYERLISATISERAGRWFVSVSCHVPESMLAPLAESDKNIGVDVGVREYVLSDGTRIETPRAYRKLESRLRHLQKSLSRKRRGSQNYRKSKQRIAKLHYHIACIRERWLHDTTNRIIADYGVIGIETLNVRGMMKNHYVAKSIHDAAFYEFGRIMEYKCEGRRVLVRAPKDYKSTETCSVCGAVRAKPLAMSRRSWTCHSCGSRLDRDVNAAVNLEVYAGELLVSACGGKVGKGLVASAARMMTAPLKQETVDVLYENRKVG